ncbi:lactonase family protein [Streptomyces physcomitrii]|uniref:Lactonase family protein n=1 Tax=Streptomyces physcomitrii TaxID=2724184 RepID=A0ABX1H100_9ACTN|nr:lactonase family protein [Streptomyces physcomitrii]NKI42021.1 lactonase family protein [Streptomyces physcomitrii]
MAAGEEQGGHAYIGSFTTAGGAGITKAAVDRETGALTVLATTDEVADPSYLALSAEGGLLYAVSETEAGAVAAFRTGGLEAAGRPVPVHGSGPTHLTRYAGYLLTANYVSGSVSAVPLTAEGTLGPEVSGVLRHEGSGPHPQRQQGPHAHQVVAAPGGRWALGVDLGTDSVHVFTLDAAGAPLPHRETALRPGSGPRHLAFHPAGEIVYVVNELTPSLTVCRWDAAGGRLQPLGEAALLPHAPAGDALASEVVVAPDGRFLWVSTRGEDVISLFNVSADGERLSLVGTVPCGGHWPRELALSPSGRHLYTANERSGNVAWFTVDQDSGVPQHGGSLDTPAPSCVIFG